MKKHTLSFLLSILFLFIGLLFFSPQKANAFCTQTSDCACNEQCNLFTCVSGLADPLQTCDYSTGRGCTEGWYWRNSDHAFIGVSNTCSTISPGNACPGSVHQPYVNGCSYSCGASCESPFYHGGFDSCGSGNYCSMDNGCNCQEWCDALPSNLQSFCAGPGGCTGNYQPVTYAGCGDGFDGSCCVLKPLCTNGTTSCGGYGSCQNAPANTCYTNNGTHYRTCYHNTLSNGSTACRLSSFTDSGSCTTDNCSAGAGYACTGGVCQAQITVHIYIDYGHDGGNDANYPFGVVKINGGNAQTTGSDGTVVYSEPVGTYTISYSDNSTDFQQTGATTQNVTLTNANGDQTVIFRVTPLYKISGNIFNDKNKNENYDGPDSLYTNTSTIHVSGGPTTVSDMTQTDGTYATPQTLLSGTYTVSQTHALADGFSYTTPSTWSVTVGNPAGNPKCNKSTSPDAGCVNPNAGSINNLNIGVTDENPWTQEACFDVRDDNGGYADQIPPSPSCGGVSGAYNTIANGSCSTGSGIIFTCNATGDFGFGSANVDNWTAGGTTAQAQECYTSAGLDVIRTSYDYLETTARESNITPIDMNGVTVCGAGGIANCTLSSTLKKGIYQANGNVNLNQYVFPAPADPTTTAWSYIFLINGDLHINGNILIPKGSVAVFSTSGNIYVDKSVGQTITNAADASNNNPNIEGLYSADGSFIINSYGSAGNYCNADGSPKDKKLNILGSVVTNASKGGGTVTNNRDLCIYDYDCTTVSGGDGSGTSSSGSSGTSGATGPGTLMNYLLTLLADGQFLNHKNFNWQELRP